MRLVGKWVLHPPEPAGGGHRPPWVARLSALLLVMVVVAVLVSLSPSAALGQADEIRVVSQSVVSDFPNNITFKLTATSPDPIEEIRVFLKPMGSDVSTYNYLDIELGTLVSGEYVMTTGTGATHRPPGTIILYSFEIRDAGGRVLRTEDEEFLYMDNSLEWKRIEDDKGLMTVYYYGAFVENRARTVLEASQKTLENMVSVLGVEPQEPIRIVSYSNYRDMTRALPFRSQAIREGLQTQGQAWPAERVLLVLSSDPAVTGIASHEFTHILVAEAAGQASSAVPAWLNEGLAEYGNIDQTPFYDRALAYAIFTRRLKPLWYLDTLSGTPDDITILYGQGKSVVRYLIDVYGKEKIAELMRTLRDTLSIDAALERVYGFDQHGLDSQWRQAFGLEPLLPPEDLGVAATCPSVRSQPRPNARPRGGRHPSRYATGGANSRARRGSDLPASSHL